MPCYSILQPSISSKLDSSNQVLGDDYCYNSSRHETEKVSEFDEYLYFISNTRVVVIFRKLLLHYCKI